MAIRNAFICMYFVFQRDDSWHVIKFSTSGDIIENVIKIVIEFDKFSSEEISVKDLMVHICMSIGMYVKFCKIHAYYTVCQKHLYIVFDDKNCPFTIFGTLITKGVGHRQVFILTSHLLHAHTLPWETGES